jgi:hypothetical protein
LPSNLFKVLSQHILELITQEYLHLQDLLQEGSQQLNNHQKNIATTQSQARAMANQQPTVQELQDLI